MIILVLLNVFDWHMNCENDWLHHMLSYNMNDDNDYIVIMITVLTRGHWIQYQCIFLFSYFLVPHSYLLLYSPSLVCFFGESP